MTDNQRDGDPRWVIVGQSDDVLAGPFAPDAHDDVMQAARTHRQRAWDRIRIITVDHLHELQDRWLNGIQYYRAPAELAATKIVATSETQFAAAHVTDGTGDVRPLTYRYREFKRDHDLLTPLSNPGSELSWAVRQELRHGLLVKERTARTELQPAYLDGQPVTDDAAWNPVVETKINRTTPDTQAGGGVEAE